MPKPLDSMWAYGEPVDPHNKQKLNCKLCGKEIYGGISRLKYHLAKIPGHGVGICEHVTPEVMRLAAKSVLDYANEKEKKEQLKAELLARTRERTPTMGASGSGLGSVPPFFSPTGATSSTMPSSLASSFFVPRSTPGGQPSIHSIIKTREKDEADRIATKCFLWGDVPFNISKNNPYYHMMFEAAAIVGPGYRGPSYNDLRGRLLQGEKLDCTNKLEELRDSWKVTGCSVMSDGWIDGKGRSILNFLVNCLRGTMFIKSVDASAYVKDAQLLCELLDNFIQEIGPQLLVQIITDNAANYVAAGRLLMQRYASLYWTPCAAHCIDLMLEDMGKLYWIKEVIDSTRSVTIYIYI